MNDAPSSKEQLKSWVQQLAPEHRRELMRILTEDDHLLHETRVEMAAEQLRRICSARGLEWDTLSEAEHEAFLDRLIREDVEATQAGPIMPSLKREAICPQCGRELTPHDLFRIYFSHRRPSAGYAVAKLIVMDTDEIAAQFPLLADSEILIGRLDPHRGIRPEIDLSPYDPLSRVSRKHVKIIIRSNKFFVEDLGSANGTFLNNHLRLKPQQPHALSNGDKIRIGHTTLKFVTSQV